ncbi:MAG TPA: pseudouridine synthase [bacterium]|nr:pseudouridine synthase [bacterium]
MTGNVRINRFLAEAGVASRRKADILVAVGRVRINGDRAATGDKVDPARDEVRVDDEPVARIAEKVWFLLNKPAGYLSAVTDDRGRHTVVELLPPTPGLFPVGRLDREVEGVLLLTTDGDTAHRLTHPSFGITKVYRVLVAGNFPDTVIRALKSGVDIAGHLCRIIDAVAVASDQTTTTLELTLAEGRKHEVKELIKAVDRLLLRLERISFAGLTAQGLKPGEYRPLTKAEIGSIKKLTAQEPKDTK